MPFLSRPAAPAPDPVTVGPAGRSAPGTIRGRRLRRGVAVAGTGLLLALTPFVLAACGSDPSSAKVDPGPQSSTSVVQKKAGDFGLHTNLTVINNSGQALPVKICNPDSFDARDAPTDCPYFNGNLQVGQQASGQGASQGIYGEVDYPDGSITYIHSDNPDIGEPYINLSTLPGGSGDSTGDVALGTGEGKPATVRDHTYQLERWGDTSYKEMRVIIK